MSILLDAGPSLSFLAASRQGALISIAHQAQLDLVVPKRVEDEVLGKARSPRFRSTPVASTWRKLRSSGRIAVLSDDVTDQRFADAIARVSGVPAQVRIRDGESLGELMVIAHGSLLAQRGEAVFLLIDERDGRAKARGEIAWLRDQSAAGELRLWSTPQMLLEAETRGWLDAEAWAIYADLRRFDDALVDIPDLRRRAT